MLHYLQPKCYMHLLIHSPMTLQTSVEMFDLKCFTGNNTLSNCSVATLNIDCNSAPRIGASTIPRYGFDPEVESARRNSNVANPQHSKVCDGNPSKGLATAKPQ
jgi:hypothetical protein